MLPTHLSTLLLKILTLILTTSIGLCENPSCGSPGRPAHGHMSVLRSSFQADETMRFTCEQRLIIVGTPERKCLSNGTWTNQVPFCVSPSPIGRSVSSGISNCSTAFPRTVDGDDETCINVNINNSTILWIIDLGKVKDETLILEVILKAEVPAGKEGLDQIQVQVSNILHESITNVRCNPRTARLDWVKQTVRLKAKKLRSHGRYIFLISESPLSFGVFRICEIIFLTREHSRFSCGDPEVPLYGIVNRSERHIAGYQCFSGYDLVGPATRICNNENEWSEAMPLCVKNVSQLDDKSLNPTIPKLPCDCENSSTQAAISPSNLPTTSIVSETSILKTTLPSSQPSMLPVYRVATVEPYFYIAVAVGIIILLFVIGFSFFICHLRHHKVSSSTATSGTDEVLMNDTYYYSDCNNQCPYTIANNYVDNQQIEGQTCRRNSRLPSSSSTNDRRTSGCSSNDVTSKRLSFSRHSAEIRERVATVPAETRNSTGSLLIPDGTHIYQEISDDHLPPT